MRKFSTLIGIYFLLVSCSPLKPLRGSYYDSEKPFTITTTKSVDEVWSKVIDLFATKGLAIKIIDKSSGLITSEKYSFLGTNTTETENGTLTNPSAWVVCTVPKLDKLAGAWNVRVKSDGAGKTIININITNLEAQIIFPKSVYGYEKTMNYDVKSTGNFERLISDLVK